jgi:hypothetical protein
MFNNISWQGYWITIALFTAGYYLIVYLLYFRKGFSIEWNRNAKSKEDSAFSAFTADSPVPQTAAVEQPSLFNTSEEFQRPAKDSIEGAVYACMDEVAAYLEEVKRSKCVKEEMLYALHGILRKYPAIAASQYKESVTNVLVSQCDFHCSVHLSADDVVRVWVGG